MYRKICSVCGREFQTAYAYQFKCTNCRGKVRAICEVCGKAYSVKLGVNTRYCPDCRGAAGGAARTGKYRAATEKFAQMRKEYAREHADVMRATAEKASKAAQNSPLAGRFETNINAKTWRLIDPSGNRHVCTNLSLFVRSHPEAFPNTTSALTMFRKQASCMRNGKPVTPKTCCGGWYVEEIPAYPEATQAYVAERERKKQDRADWIARKRRDYSDE